MEGGVCLASNIHLKTLLSHHTAHKVPFSWPWNVYLLLIYHWYFYLYANSLSLARLCWVNLLPGGFYGGEFRVNKSGLGSIILRDMSVSLWFTAPWAQWKMAETANTNSRIRLSVTLSPLLSLRVWRNYDPGACGHWFGDGVRWHYCSSHMISISAGTGSRIRLFSRSKWQYLLSQTLGSDLWMPLLVVNPR